MFQHQIDVLKAEITKPEYTGKTADEVYELLARGPLIFHQFPRLLAGRKENGYTQFVEFPGSKGLVEKSSIPKDDPVHKLLEDFPGGVPGMPNLIRRPFFDQAWKEVRG